MRFSKSYLFIISILFLFLMSACSGGGGSDSDGGSGDLTVSLTDSAGAYKAVYITVESLEVHTGGNGNGKKNWQTIDMDKDTINLCDLTNGVFEELGSIRLDTGKYTQLRLHLSETHEDSDELNILSQKHPSANYVILEDDTIHELKIPSGYKTGVKIVKGFTINDNGTTEMILDFDAMSSVVEAGNSGQWLLKPTIKVGELDDYSIINGRVTDDSDQGIEGVYVSAQIFDDEPQDDKDKVVIQAGTLTDNEGYYSIFVMPGTYNLVAFIDGKEFEFVKVETVAGETLENSDITDFQLVDASAIGTIEGDVSINGADDEQYATISYRHEVGCPDDCEMIEIITKNLKSTTIPHEVELPIVGGGVSYQRVASSVGYETETENLTLIADDSITDDIELTD